jgi:hypothetical protein
MSSSVRLEINLFTAGTMMRATTSDPADVVSAVVRSAVITAVINALPKPVRVDVDGVEGSLGGASAFERINDKWSHVRKVATYNMVRVAMVPCERHPGSGFDIGHVVHRVYGGNLTPGNLKMECSRCNREKSATVSSGLYEILIGVPIVVILPTVVVEELIS